MTSPRTPNRRRRSSGIDTNFSPSSSHSNGFSSTRYPHSRKSSLSSMQSPSTPRPMSSHSRNGDFKSSNGFGSVVDSANGLGNLADELAEAWDEEEEGQHSGLQINGYDAPSTPPQLEIHGSTANGLTSSGLPPQSEHSLSPTKPSSRTKHRRKASQYDGSDYGSDPEEVEGISPTLEARMAAIEHLARRGTEANGSDADTVIQRLAESLKDLGSQAGVENGASRLITSDTSLTTHLTHTTRLLTSLTSTLLSPLSVPLSTSEIDDILPLLAPLFSTLPTPNPANTSSLRALTASTNDIISTLSALSDSLHMTRQTSSLASRRLQSTKAMMLELQKEQELGEEGRRWIEDGQWEKRLREREGKRVCGDVVGGFERFCEGWRERLVQGAVEIGAA